ncbi:MAG: tetratricopeptide repeat protein [Opitutaceae bacterium]
MPLPAAMDFTRASAAPPSPRRTIGAASLIATAGLIAYANTFSAPFIFDDPAAIVETPMIGQLWPLEHVLSSPSANGVTLGGRPLLNLTFALNHAISGTQVWSYHALNLLIHLLAGVTLFGIVRRTLTATRFAADASSIALFSALLWTLHPLQTESVTYVVQRAESLIGLLYLLTIYAFIRAAGSGRLAWSATSVAACWLASGTKAVAATAPMLVLLYDRTWISGTVRAALRARPGYYVGLALIWPMLGWLFLGTAERGGPAGLNVGVSPVAYAVSQLRAVTHYVGLSVWPSPLVIDHGGTLAFESIAAALPFAFFIAALLALTGFALSRFPAMGYCGAWFFVVLAPSSSVVPQLDTCVEHRIYLALAAPVVALVIGAFAVLGRRAPAILSATALVFAGLTLNRNATYRSEIGLWLDNVAHTPANPRAHFRLGNALLAAGRAPAAVDAFHAAVRLKPDYFVAHSNLGNALLAANRVPEAIVALEAALRLSPIARTHFTTATAFAQLGRTDEALVHYDAALRLDPGYAEALNNRGNLHLQKNQPQLALADYEAALRLDPTSVDRHLNAAVALFSLHRLGEAAAHAEAAVRLRPNYAPAHWKLGDALLELGRLPEALERYHEAVRLDPALVYAHYNLARVLTQLGRTAEAIAAFERTVQLAPEWAVAHHHFARALEAAGQIPRAIEEDEAALRLQPEFPGARDHLAQLRRRAP